MDWITIREVKMSKDDESKQTEEEARRDALLEMISEQVGAVTEEDVDAIEEFVRSRFDGPYGAIAAMVYTAANLTQDKHMFQFLMRVSVASAVEAIEHEELASKDVPAGKPN